SQIVAVGLISGGGSGTDAEVTSSATTDALIDDGASVNVNNAVTVDATSTNHATSTPSQIEVGGITLLYLAPTAKVGGDTKAYVDGGVSAGSLQVQARAQNQVTAIADLFNLSIGGGSGADAEAEVQSTAST